MADDRYVLRRVAWRELCPWLIIFRCFGLSVSLPVLFLAVVGTMLMPWGARLIGQIVPAEAPLPLASLPFAADLDELVSPQAAWDGTTDRLPMGGAAAAWPGFWSGTTGAGGVYWSFVRPIRQLFDRQASFSQFLGNLLLTLWNVAVWGLFGGAITRIAVVQFGREERVTLFDALRHVLANWGWYFSAPLFPLLGVAVMLMPLVILGFAMRLDLLAAAAALVWPLALLLGVSMTILLLGLLGGWPLMWPTIGAEEDSDAFEAFSRSFSYTFQRPLQYLFYAAVAVAFSQLSWFLVGQFASAVISLTHWGVSFGAGGARVNEILGASHESGTLLHTSAGLIGWWSGLVRTIAVAFNYALFFCMASVVYLLLRREVDQTDFDEVFMPDQATRYGLPALRSGPEGVPEIEERPAEAPSTPS